MNSSKINILGLIIALTAGVVFFLSGWMRLEIDTDIMGSLPKDDPVIQHGVEVLMQHPMQDQITLDVMLQKQDIALSLKCADFIEAQLRESGLFQSVGNQSFTGLIPKLSHHIIDHLPYLFTEADLTERVAPRLTKSAIESAFEKNYQRLLSLDAVGQSEFISKDPLSLKDILMGHLSFMIPAKNAQMIQGKIFSQDGKHVLIMAESTSSSTDTAFARKVSALMNDLSKEVQRRFSNENNTVIMTSVGAYRAALDNEIIVRRDVNYALFFATLGIAILLCFSFHRPLIGLLSLLPALTGTMTAFFIFSFFYSEMSIIVLGFGGAIISITVDHGIAYFLFLDREEKTKGKTASREVWAIGLIAVLTTIGAFSALFISGFPILEQLGLFAALGIFFSFLFVHLVFPLCFQEMSPASPRQLPFKNLVGKLPSIGNKSAVCLFLLGCVMFFFSYPKFDVDLSSMNTVSQETLAAEKVMKTAWGDIFNKVFMVTEAESAEYLMEKGDRLFEMIGEDVSKGPFDSGFCPAVFFPGNKRRAQNLAAWKAFWNSERIDKLNTRIAYFSNKFGYTRDAFTPFLQGVNPQTDEARSYKIPENIYKPLGVYYNEIDSKWIYYTTLEGDPEKTMPGHFYDRYQGIAKIFNPIQFSDHLGEVLFDIFLKMLIIIAVSVTLLIFFFFLSFRLTLITLFPVGFAFICSLGTLNLLEVPLNIPTLILSIIVLGMGIDYSLFLVRAYQRYGSWTHVYSQSIQMSVFMAAVSTLIGFGVLILAKHSLLKSVGVVSFLGVGYALTGAFVFIPKLMSFLFRDEEKKRGLLKTVHQRVRFRYRLLEAYPKMFARFKLKYDPLFLEMKGLLKDLSTVERVVDIGSGYGVPACWMAERFKGSTVYGLEPDTNRVTVASRALGGEGEIQVGGAPYLDHLPKGVDIVLMLDMMHYLDDDSLLKTLKQIKVIVQEKGVVLIRVPVDKNKGSYSWTWHLENFKMTIQHARAYYRTVDEISSLLKRAELDLKKVQISGNKGEMMWFYIERTSI